MKKLVLAILAVCWGWPATAATAADLSACRLTRYASIPMITTPDGRIAIPVTVDGHQASFMVDTGGVVASMTQQLSKDIGRSPKEAENWLSGVGGSVLWQYVNVGSFSIGKLSGSGMPVYIDPRLLGSGVDGTVDPDMMSHFGVDLDFAKGVMNLFAPDHCPGQVVYWTQTPYVVLPMDVRPNSGHIRVPVLVDGKQVMAILDTGARSSVMSLGVAKALGVTENAPDLKLKSSGGPNSKAREYTYPFKTLDMGGVAVNNPHIAVFSDGMLPGPDLEMIVGIGIMRQLHLFIDYKEKKLYISPAMAN